MCEEKFPIYIDKLYIKNNISIKVVRDDIIPGGTKQRAINVLFKCKNKEYIYAGPNTGYAQVALAYAGKKHNERVTIFLSKQKETLATKKARSLGAKIYYTKKYSISGKIL